MGRSPRPRAKYLGKKLLQIRNQLGVSQVEMVNRLGFQKIHPAHVSAYERGVREPPLAVLLKYAQLADVSTDSLIDDRIKSLD
jgi:transcriptional regulator with XRE-family HTH domain